MKERNVFVDYEDGVKDGINKAFIFFETNMEELKNILNSNSSDEVSKKIRNFAEQLMEQENRR